MFLKKLNKSKSRQYVIELHLNLIHEQDAKTCVEGTVSIRKERSSLGAHLARNSKGEVIAAFAKSYLGMMPSRTTKAWALLHALTWCKDHQIKIHEVKADCLNLA
ncbi:hypothetical protein F8388_012377 [Cannabis sativa]|uniref:RNase H type-1 domain-containing protein n=1 Tax=Cannabis sativa TaxID=3483 RepID=A0A7J6DYA3_CANSA|nr:hypothetical protein G4B88_007197 [Cannabis sativa]KAF4377276.1 hypothetical protein F8388_012377 [Cannabis sativa]